ncbi:MAG: septal ring lytic transglycosylase RlpA family protein [Candidatus Wallbacteria bacterium]|nr:septal ring lytic transglycosylase RlpA family protein [Candidatus Wallbacteria bacterium]
MEANRALLAVAAAGWLFAAPQLTAATAPAPTEGELRKLSVSLLGARYREGGRSREAGFDAGGLISFLYGRAGHAVPSREETLVQAGGRVAVEDLQPWDILVLGPGPAGEDAGLGLFVGGVDFLLASRKQRTVVVAQLDEDRWRGRLVMGRRLFGAPEPKREFAGHVSRPIAVKQEEESGEEPDYRAGKRPAAKRAGGGCVGVASYYGHSDGMSGRRTSSGETLARSSMTAAHRTFPFGTKLRVTNLANGRWVVVRVNDRGPHRRDRILDVSFAAARKLGFLSQGLARVRIEVLRNETSRSS